MLKKPRVCLMQYMSESLLRGSERFRRAAVALMPAVFKKAASSLC